MLLGKADRAYSHACSFVISTTSSTSPGGGRVVLGRGMNQITILRSCCSSYQAQNVNTAYHVRGKLKCVTNHRKLVVWKQK